MNQDTRNTLPDGTVAGSAIAAGGTRLSRAGPIPEGASPWLFAVEYEMAYSQNSYSLLPLFVQPPVASGVAESVVVVANGSDVGVEVGVGATTAGAGAGVGLDVVLGAIFGAT